MAATDINILKSWYETGDVPTQEQFWAWFESYWHKNEKIPITSITQIEEILNDKADKEAFDNHLTDENAHAGLFAKTRIIPFGQFLVFKAEGNANESEKEPGDYCLGIVENSFVSGSWTGDNDQLKSSYE
ncbi:hypothetical protein [Flavobacterium hydrophilum]|uniref:Uncharacterized protein n=1 Tax=Flavobacterium hydrophilum TaxID=2211445 RepID=A0A2V4C055_9FLAO|nr:hypothetical protein [Flavobacterium hydrophilum]PXY44535.1 hypothetical protein DMB68_13790 [Flavobacterium hydrophilum]